MILHRFRYGTAGISSKLSHQRKAKMLYFEAGNCTGLYDDIIKLSASNGVVWLLFAI